MTDINSMEANVILPYNPGYFQRMTKDELEEYIFQLDYRMNNSVPGINIKPVENTLAQAQDALAKGFFSAEKVAEGHTDPEVPES